jgi:hypothetical protein
MSIPDEACARRDIPSQLEVTDLASQVKTALTTRTPLRQITRLLVILDRGSIG